MSRTSKISVQHLLQASCQTPEEQQNAGQKFTSGKPANTLEHPQGVGQVITYTQSGRVR